MRAPQRRQRSPRKPAWCLQTERRNDHEVANPGGRDVPFGALRVRDPAGLSGAHYVGGRHLVVGNSDTAAMNRHLGPISGPSKTRPLGIGSSHVRSFEILRWPVAPGTHVPCGASIQTWNKEGFIGAERLH